MGCLRLVPDVKLINAGVSSASSQAMRVHRFPGNSLVVVASVGRDIRTNMYEQMPAPLYRLLECPENCGLFQDTHPNTYKFSAIFQVSQHRKFVLLN